MAGILDAFAALGRRIEGMWAARDREEEALPGIAACALDADPLAGWLDVDALAAALLDPAVPYPRQMAPAGAFGQPGVTLHHGHGFVIDVYFWRHSLAAIHNHPFAGLFCILRGPSLHAVYDFAPREARGPNVVLGRLALRELSVLGDGDRVLFSRRERPLIHTLLHVPVGAVSLVVRTIRTSDYFRYLPPGLAVAMAEADDDLARQARLLETLRASGSAAYAAGRDALLAGADFESTFRILSQLLPGADAEERGPLLALAESRHGEAARLIAAAVDEAGRMQGHDALRARLRDVRDRFVVSALMCADTRERALAAIGAFAGGDPVPWLMAWLEGTEVLPRGDAAREVARLLIEGAAPSEITARIATGVADERARGERAIERFCAESIFAALVRRRAGG